MAKPARNPPMEKTTVIVGMKDGKYPIIASTQTTPRLALWAPNIHKMTLGTQTTFYCDWCKKWHMHGGESLDEEDWGHRGAHCAEPSPMHNTGYFLKNVKFVEDLSDLEYVRIKEQFELEWLFGKSYMGRDQGWNSTELLYYAGSWDALYDYWKKTPQDQREPYTHKYTEKRIDKLLISPERVKQPEDYHAPNARTIFKLSQRYRWAPRDIMRWLADNPNRYHPWRTVVKHIAEIRPEYQGLADELAKP